MKKRWISALLALAALLSLACGCAAPAKDEEGEIVYLGALLDDQIPLAGLPAISIVLNPTAPGTAAQKNSSAVIDYSNAKDGYVMVKWTGSGSPKLKVLIKGPKCADTYKYDLPSNGEYAVFPLSDGNGSYQIGVYKNISGDQYSDVLSARVSAQLTDEFAPFIRPNQYVNYSENSEAVSMARHRRSGPPAEISALGAGQEVPCGVGQAPRYGQRPGGVGLCALGFRAARQCERSQEAPGDEGPPGGIRPMVLCQICGRGDYELSHDIR